MKYVKDIMTSPVISIDETASIQDVAKIMAEKNIGSVAVMQAGKLMGIITERDISKKIVAVNRNPVTTSVKDIMQTHLITAVPETTVEEASNVLSTGKFRRLPVMAGDKLAGIVTETDIELAMHEEALEESKARVKDHYKFSEQIRQQDQKIADLKKTIMDLEKQLK
jgi:CBS domain-containing protein